MLENIHDRSITRKDSSLDLIVLAFEPHDIFHMDELKIEMHTFYLSQVGYNAYDNQGELQTDEQFQEVLHKTVPDLSMGYNN